MKRILLIIISILCVSCLWSSAQTISGSHTSESNLPVSWNFDSDLRQICINGWPSYQQTWDDYTQYAPAAVMLGLKACGVKGMSSWGKMLTASAASAGVMAIAVNGLKYTVKRPRPDGASHNSWPSGHTATAFMTASLLHKEYGWRSPWYSIGAYTVATATGLSRILNNRHWFTDILAGAAIGIGSVELGYFISGLIFRNDERHINEGYEKPELSIDPEHRYYAAELLFGYRFILGGPSDSGSDFSSDFGADFGGPESSFRPEHGGVSGIQVDIPIVPRWGASARASANSIVNDTLSPSHNIYNFYCGGYYNRPFARILEVQGRVMAGYAHHSQGGGFALAAGASLGVFASNAFKFKAFAEYEAFEYTSSIPWVNSLVVGLSTGFVF